MIALLRLFLAIVASLLMSKARLAADNAAIRRQLIVLRRKLPGGVKLSNEDRLFFVWLYRLFPSALGALLSYSAGDHCPLASCRLPLLLAVEIAPTLGPPAG
jgi:hypothetical protein